jgi:hypothetical protein
VLLFGVVVVVLVASALALGWASDHRDRRTGHTRYRSDREMWSSARRARREARWRRAQLDREIMPRQDLNDGK